VGIRAATIVMEMLKAHQVKYVFGFPGETTLPLYLAWHDCPDVTHVLARDERSASFMADAYSRFSGQPGVCEGPGVGATHMIPGVAEAYKASVPMVVFTSDVPLGLERRNMLTGMDQTALFAGVTKESMTLSKGADIPSVIRRAFRLATAGKPGPVHVRLPLDVLLEEAECEDIYADPDFTRCPGHRPCAELDKVEEAVGLLAGSERPLIVCGGGVLISQAWAEVTELAELAGIPVGTTMTGKGSIAETHPLSIGVIGSRGGTSCSNSILEDADLIFYIGSNTDSAGTAGWTLPPLGTDKKIIHLDISEAETGNSYRTHVSLIGDAKSTLMRMIEVAASRVEQSRYCDLPRIREIRKRVERYGEYVTGLTESADGLVHPLRFIRELSRMAPDRHVIIADPGVSAIYLSAFFKTKRPGRTIVFNYSMGALGYAVPASVGAHYARLDDCVVVLTGDGSFGLCCGELETIARTQGNIKIFLFNNRGFGWIKAALRFSYKPKYFACDFNQIDHVRIAEGFGLAACRVESDEELDRVLEGVFDREGPVFVEVNTASEEDLVPPVPAWAVKAAELGLPYIY
jgi:acetolactate synthase-1/2/3 large subunit